MASLESRLSHPAFPQPDNPGVKVWRYMDLSKLVWLLTRKELYFSRLDALQDPFEGSTTRKTVEGVKEFMRRRGYPQTSDEVLKIFGTARKSMYVSCWCALDNESEAMWRLYCPAGQGIAIQSTYESLKSSIRDLEVYIGRVSYVDYDEYNFRNINVLAFAMHKRLAFAHESEIRMVQSKQIEVDKTGITIPWAPSDFVHGVYVDPYAPEHYFDAVRAIVDQFAPDMSGRLTWSRMKAVPI